MPALPTDAAADLALAEARRLATLRRVALLDTPAEEAFDRLTRLACLILDVPVALVSLVDADRQFFKSCVGLPEPWASTRETPLSHSFCQHTVASARPLVIEDAREHPLVRENLAIRDLDVIAYAGIPLITSDGHVLGSFCAIDGKPRTWSAQDLTVLTELAGSAMTIIELRASTLMLAETQDDRDRIGEQLREAEARERAAEQRRVDDLLDVSERLQRGLLPVRPATAGSADVFTFYRPGARTLLLGGDFFDVLERDDTLHFILADVAGHGPEAAALAVALRAAWAALHQREVGPLESLEQLNRIAMRERPGETMFVTALAGAYDHRTRELTLATAGHPAPLMLTPATASDDVILTPGPPIGLFDEARWTQTTVTLAPGSAVMAYTDGLIEGRAEPGSMARLGTTGIVAEVERLIAGQDISDTLLNELYITATRHHGARLEDDVAMLIVRPAAS